MALKGLFLGPIVGLPIALITIVLVWSIVWKGIALWRSARHGQKGWFITLLIVNTIGLLEILYLALFQKKVKRSK